jgi:uncharacterized protein YndB with AHSA1/START domain
MTSNVARRTDRAERVIRAPADRLFACWTDPELLVHWLPPRGMSGRVEVFDPTPGRPFRIVLSYEDAADHGKSGGGEDVVAGMFVVVEPPRHLAFVCRFDSDDPAFQGEMRMDWHFDPIPEGTLVRIIASDVPSGISEQDHAAGMGSSLTQLAALVE